MTPSISALPDMRCSLCQNWLSRPHVWSSLLTGGSITVLYCASGPFLAVLQRRQTMQSPDYISSGCARGESAATSCSAM